MLTKNHVIITSECIVNVNEEFRKTMKKGSGRDKVKGMVKNIVVKRLLVDYLYIATSSFTLSFAITYFL